MRLSVCKMQRYTVNFRETNVTTRRLLVPFDSGSSIIAFASELQRRLARAGIVVQADAILFRLDDVNGPLIDGEDTLEDVILDPRVEQLFASVPGSSTNLEGGLLASSADTPMIDFLVCCNQLLRFAFANNRSGHSGT